MQMVGQSAAFLACVDNLARVADCEASILLFGESGVGKELAARFITPVRRAPAAPSS